MRKKVNPILGVQDYWGGGGNDVPMSKIGIRKRKIHAKLIKHLQMQIKRKTFCSYI